MPWNNNALGITGIDKSQIKFWINPFSKEKGLTACHVFIEGVLRWGGGGGELIGLKVKPF